MSGELKIFLGMAAGVGKTYRMLQEGRAAAESGRDVVIGYLEPHDRPETEAQAAGLELLPRLRGQRTGEMDLAALLARKPDLALVDELAHTNAAGLKHVKRFEDVRELLAAGIDVYSTVNVQHLESLNDQVADLTGVRVRETLPDAVLAGADEVMLVDLTPSALIQRLREGRIYAPERVPAALNGFFKVEQLAALREVALRQVAEDVESKRLVRPANVRMDADRLMDAAGPQAVGERLLGLVTPDPSSQRVARRAWRSAQRLGAELDLLWVGSPSEEPSAEQRRQLDALRRLASVLGATLLIEHGDRFVDVVRRVAVDRAATYVVLGVPESRPGRRRLLKLIEALPGVDVRLVADRTKRDAARTGSTAHTAADPDLAARKTP